MSAPTPITVLSDDESTSSVPTQTESPPPRLSRLTSFSPSQDPVQYALRGVLTVNYDQGIRRVVDFIREEFREGGPRLTLVDGSNLFYLDHATDEWTFAHEKAELLRSIPTNHGVVVFMKHDTFATIRDKFPIRRLLATASNVCIVTVDIPFCKSGLMANCLRSMRDRGVKLCSISRRTPPDSRAVQPPRTTQRTTPYARPHPRRVQVTSFRHLFCEYDDLLISEVFHEMHPRPRLLSLDRDLPKSRASRDTFMEFNPIVTLQLFRVTSA